MPDISITRIENLTPTIKGIWIALDAATPLDFQAGQYVHEAAKEHFGGDFRGHKAYLCGPPQPTRNRSGVRCSSGCEEQRHGTSGSLSHRIHDYKDVEAGTLTISDEFYSRVDQRVIASSGTGQINAVFPLPG